MNDLNLCPGQTCVTANRIMIQAGIYDRILDNILPKIKAMKVHYNININNINLLATMS